MRFGLRLNGLRASDYVILKGKNGPVEGSKHRSRRTVDVTPFTMGLLLFVLALLSALSFLAGQRVSAPTATNILGLKPTPYTFEYNPTFAGRPNITTNKAWLDLFPMQGGFFSHPRLAPQRSAFAVFHQLHCLDGIRHAYWTLLDMVMQDKKISKADLPHHTSPKHVQHCIDLLRNALMCQPDLTLEVMDKNVGGVTGFGTEHSCVDWRELVEWTSEWEVYDDGSEDAEEVFGHRLREGAGHIRRI